MAPDWKGQGAGAPRASLAASRGSQLEFGTSHLAMERRGSGSACEPVDKQALESKPQPSLAGDRRSSERTEGHAAPYPGNSGRTRPNLFIPSSGRNNEVDSLAEVVDDEVICSQTMAAGIDDDGGSCFRPRHLAGTDTATNPSYPTLSDVDQVADCDTTGANLSTTAPATSLVSDL